MLDAHALAGAMAPVFDPPETARGLPNLCYVDPAYHRLEAERLLARDWLCVGVGADIPGRGDAVAVDAAGQPVLLVRDRDGRSEEHTSELQALMRLSYAVFSLK